MTKHVLIAGASGLVGYAALQHFETLPDFQAYGNRAGVRDEDNAMGRSRSHGEL